MTNFGVEPFLDHFVELAPPPRTRATSAGHARARRRRRSPAFVFKIQANMDPQPPRPHRLRAHLLGPLRARHGGARTSRTGKTLALTRPLQFLAQERTHDRRGLLRRHHRPVGRRQPAHRRHAVRRRAGSSSRASRASRPSTSCACGSTDPLKRKQLKKGLDQLSEEGAVQLFFDRTRLERDPDPGRRRRAAVRGGPAPAASRVRRERRLRPPALQARALGRGRASRPRQVRAARRRPPACSTSRGGRWCCSTTTGRCARPIEDNPQLKFIAAVQPGRAARPAA